MVSPELETTGSATLGASPRPTSLIRHNQVSACSLASVSSRFRRLDTDDGKQSSMSCPVASPDVDSRMRQVLATHRLPLTCFILGLTLGHHQRTEDLVQETMVRAWRNLDALPPEDDAGRRWLFTVARHLVIDEVRRRQARPVEVAPLDAERSVTGDVTAAAALANQALRESVANLSTAHREVLHEVFFEDRPVPDVAARLGIPAGTVRSRIHYAIRFLREAVIG